jgi:hydroxymethylglutaryl-CoA reductase
MTDSTLKSLSRMTYEERLAYIGRELSMTPDEIIETLRSSFETIQLAEALIEGAIGYFSMPMGFLKDLKLNEKNYIVPMAIEETSIVAGVNKIAKWVREKGKLESRLIEEKRGLIGQIQIPRIVNLENFQKTVEGRKQAWIDLANKGPAKSMVLRGGGVQDIELRLINREDNSVMGVLHIFVDVCDAMGANIINQVSEFLKPIIIEETDETLHLCILSNLNDHKRVRVTLTMEDFDECLGRRIEEASYFAEYDPYRAVTHNKGIMNGIDAVLIATGNDFRAVEAGLHAYAALQGRYKPLSTWRYAEGTLTGVLEAPLNLGIVGGVTSIHPTAGLALKLLKVEDAEELMQVVGAVGLIQNLAALRALCSEGIVSGHMRLHLKNILMTIDATESEQKELEQRLLKILLEKKYVSRSNALDELQKLRA